MGGAWPRAGNARLSIVAPGWGSIQLDGGTPMATPAWDVPIDAGPHAVVYKKADGTSASETVMVAVDGVNVVVLP